NQGYERMSPVRFLLKTTLPAPIIATLIKSAAPFENAKDYRNGAAIPVFIMLNQESIHARHRQPGPDRRLSPRWFCPCSFHHQRIGGKRVSRGGPGLRGADAVHRGICNVYTTGERLARG